MVSIYMRGISAIIKKTILASKKASQHVIYLSIYFTSDDVRVQVVKILCLHSVVLMSPLIPQRSMRRIIGPRMQRHICHKLCLRQFLQSNH